MDEKIYDEQLARVEEFHGHLCGGIAIGTKLAMYGLELLGMELNQRHKNQALRISDADANKKFKDRETKEEMIEKVRKTPAEELFKVEKVKIEIPPSEMPGKPHTTAFCSLCGEKVSDGRHKLIGGEPICISCAEGSYYELI